MAYTFSPQGQTYPPETQPDQSGIPIVQGRSGAMHTVGVGGNPLTLPRGSAGANKPGFPQANMPDIGSWMEAQAKINKIPSLATADDETLMGLFNDYANKHVPAFHESSGYKLDKAQQGAAIDNFTTQAYQDRDKFRKYFADKENAEVNPLINKASVEDQITGLGQRAAASTLTGLANITKGIPGVLHTVSEYSNPLVTAARATGLMASGPSKDEIAKQLGPILNPAENYLREGAAQNLPGGSQYDPKVAKALINHPIWTGVADFLGNAAPLVASGPFAGVTGAAQFGGQAAKEQEDRIMGMKDSELKAIPEYQHAFALTKDPDVARTIVAKATADASEGIGQAFGAVMNTMGGGALTQPAQAAIAKMVGNSAFRRVLASTLGEAGGFAALGAGQQKAESEAIKAKTGEQKEPDYSAGLGENTGLGALFGLIGSLARLGKAKPGEKPGSETPSKSGEQPPPLAAGAAPVAEAKPVDKTAIQTPYTEARDKVVEGLGVKPGATSGAKLEEAANEFANWLRVDNEGIKDEEVSGFVDQFRKEFSKPVEGAAPVQPAVKETEPTPQEATAAVAPETPGEALQAAPIPAPEPVALPVEAKPPEPVMPQHKPVEEPAGQHKQEEPPKESTLREIVTHPGVDPRLPFGVTERIAEQLRNSLGRDPSPEAINTLSHHILDSAEVNIDDVVRREALGKLLEEKPNEIPDRQEINKKAGDLLDPRNNQNARKIALDRMREFDQHPAKVSERQGMKFKDVLRKTDELQKQQATNREETTTEADKAKNAAVQAALDHSEGLRKEQEVTEKATKDAADQKFRDVLKKTSPEAKKKRVNALEKQSDKKEKELGKKENTLIKKGVLPKQTPK